MHIVRSVHYFNVLQLFALKSLHVSGHVASNIAIQGQRLTSLLALQVAVCTPGRMIDLIKMKACTMRRTTFLVFDEADRMFDMGFEPQVHLLPLLTLLT